MELWHQVKNIWKCVWQLEFTDIICSNNTVCFIKYIGNKAAGFAQCKLGNDYVEGTATSPAGYLEGILLVQLEVAKPKRKAYSNW